ncbi:MAG: amino acid ABC transporter ATP-binding protein [Alphaproteobacteria bacterium]|nr:amino acid ABC transporter ATP-binding protein [Alphaproteobacteria bacterium]
MDARPIVIEARGVSRRLGTVQALDTVDIELRHGETIVIVGPSGSGKSTLLRCLNWLETPDAGEIRLAGETVGFVTSPDGSRRPRPKAEIDAQRRRLGMVFQRFNLFEHLTALRNVAIAPERVLGLTRDEAETRARTHLVRLGLGDRLNSLPGALSGGQKQRVAIARALAMRPEALLLDEPTSALDPESVGEFLGVLRDLARDGVTMAVVTHELGFARAVADRLIVMDRGRIVEAGPPAEVLDSPRHPRTVALLSALSTRPAVVT